MKAEHRHELKTNELADWLGHFPQWARENVLTIAAVLAVVAVAVAFYLWRGYAATARADRQVQLTSLVDQLAQSKMHVYNQQTRGGDDVSYVLLEPAKNFEAFAQTEKDPRMVALALIKRAEALRAEVHYRPGVTNKQDLSTRINEARESYAAALEKAAGNVSLVAKAKFGIALCDEELGNFEQAEKTYREILDNPDFEPTVAFAQAGRRINTIAEYRQTITLNPAPKPKPVTIRPGPFNTTPADPNRPVAVSRPADTNSPVIIAPKPDANTPAPVNVPAVTLPADANTPAAVNDAVDPKPQPLVPEPNSKPAADVNVPG